MASPSGFIYILNRRGQKCQCSIHHMSWPSTFLPSVKMNWNWSQSKEDMPPILNSHSQSRRIAWLVLSMVLKANERSKKTRTVTSPPSWPCQRSLTSVNKVICTMSWCETGLLSIQIICFFFPMKLQPYSQKLSSERKDWTKLGRTVCPSDDFFKGWHITISLKANKIISLLKEAFTTDQG